MIETPDFIRTQLGQIHSLSATLRDSDGPLDIPPGSTVSFVAQNGLQPPTGDPLPTIGGNGVVVQAGATADDPERGVVRYDLSISDVANAGLFYGQFLLTPTDSSFPVPIPEGSRLTLLITPLM